MFVQLDADVTIRPEWQTGPQPLLCCCSLTRRLRRAPLRWRLSWRWRWARWRRRGRRWCSRGQKPQPHGPPALRQVVGFIVSSGFLSESSGGTLSSNGAPVHCRSFWTQAYASHAAREQLPLHRRRVQLLLAAGSDVNSAEFRTGMYHAGRVVRVGSRRPKAEK
jgi:hypothetical protein